MGTSMKKNTKGLHFAVNRASLSGPKSKQYRIRNNAKAFATELQRAGLGVKKWENLTNKHFQGAADSMKARGVGDGRIAEVFSAARHVCNAYGNDGIARENKEFGVERGRIANKISRAADPEKVVQIIDELRNGDNYRHSARCAAQIELQYELGLRREESAKVDLVNDWDREQHTLLVHNGTKGGRPRTLHLSPQQEAALRRAEEFVSPSDRKGIFNLMPEGMGDKWLNKLDYAARKSGLTKKKLGYTLHGNRHERFRQVYVGHTGFQPPNQHRTHEDFVREAQKSAGPNWSSLDSEARDQIEVMAGHSPGRRDISDAYLGSSKTR